VAVSLGLSVLATAAAPAPHMPEGRAALLAEGVVYQPKRTFEDAIRVGRRVRPRVESLFGRKVRVPVVLAIKKLGEDLALTSPARRDGQGGWEPVRNDPREGCLIELDPEALELGSQNFRGLLAHEITHCLTQQAAGSVPAALDLINTSKWLAEGSAELVAYQLVGKGWAYTESWNPYITLPEKGLRTRDYDAVGFFAHIGRRPNPWKVAYAMWSEWRKDVFKQEDPFLIAQRSLGKSRAAQDRFLQTWAMSYARRSDLGRDWQMVGPAIPGPTVRASPREVTIGRLGPSRHTVVDASVKLLRLTVAKGLVIRVSSIGFGAIRWEPKTRTEARLARETVLDYCIIDCPCPTGETLDPIVQKVTASSALLALTGGAGKGFVSIRVRDMSDVCVPGTASTDGPDPCIYTEDEATGLIASKVGGHHPVEEVQMQFFPKAPPIPKHVSPPKRGVKLVTACLYLSSFGDAIWVDRLADEEKGSPWDKSLWISYLGYPRDEVLTGTGCC